MSDYEILVFIGLILCAAAIEDGLAQIAKAIREHGTKEPETE